MRYRREKGDMLLFEVRLPFAVRSPVGANGLSEPVETPKKEECPLFRLFRNDLLDEPSMGLAPLLMLSMFEALKEINRTGTTILLVEQNARLALKFAQRGYVMENGHIVLEGESRALRENPQVKTAYLGG